MSVVVITGTGTGVGKTVATAALACHARVAGLDVAVCKPVQTGTADGDDDLAEVGRLSGVTELVGVARYPEPLAPAAAAEHAGQPLPSLAELLRRDPSRRPARAADPGRGRRRSAGRTGRRRGRRCATWPSISTAPVLIVTEPGLGTLNHTALTLEALARQGCFVRRSGDRRVAG